MALNNLDWKNRITRKLGICNNILKSQFTWFKVEDTNVSTRLTYVNLIWAWNNWTCWVHSLASSLVVINQYLVDYFGWIIFSFACLRQRWLPKTNVAVITTCYRVQYILQVNQKSWGWIYSCRMKALTCQILLAFILINILPVVLRYFPNSDKMIRTSSNKISLLPICRVRIGS